MTAEFLEQQTHVETPRPPAPSGRVVLSRLPRGESQIARSALSLKVVLEGEERYEIDGRTWRLAPGEVLLVRPGQAMRVVTPARDGARGLCLYFQPGVAGQNLTALDDIEAPVLLPLVDHALGRWLGRVAPALVRRPDLGPRAAGRILRGAATGLEGFMADTRRRVDRIPAAKPVKRIELLRRVEIARERLHADISRTPSLAELGAEAGLSPFHLARCFTAAHGVPPAAYHRAWRLDVAADRLAAGASPARLALEVGFADQAAFTRAFRRRHGRTPGDMRPAQTAKP